jgi:DNA-binding NarL/FixJ family response regulator/tetratricopeptide (TPR) repeat protein
VLVLDDLHWADSGALELIGALLRRPPAAPVLLALALRPRQIPDRLWAALERAQRAGAVTYLEVGGLSADEARELVGADAGGFYAESGGNPFYLQQLARSPRRQAAPPTAVGEVPDAVLAALGAELALLPGDVRRLLEGAAVAGDPFVVELAAAAAGVPEPAAIESLDELLVRDLIRPTDVPRRFRFRHPLVRAAVYAAAPGGWRLGAHERCAAALAAGGAAAPARAHHVEQAARHGDFAAIAVLREAGEAVAQHAPAGAARWFAAALRLLPDTAPAQERVGLLSARAGALAAVGRFSEAHAALLEGLALVPAEAIDLRVRLTAGCAGLEQLLGRHADAHRRLVAALGEADPDSPQAAALTITLAHDAIFQLRYADGRTWGERALAVARPLGGRPLTAAAAAALALAGACAGAIAEAQRHRAEAAGLVDAMADDELAQRLDAVATLAAAECYLDRFAEAGAHAERGLALARATGQGELLPMLIPALHTVLLVSGRLGESAELLDGAVEGARLAHNDQTLAWYLFNRALIAAVTGELDLARATAEEAAELARPLGASFVAAYADVTHAVALWEAGELARGVELATAGAGDQLELLPGAWRAYFLDRLVAARLALGRRAEAERGAAAAEEVAAATGLRLAAALARRARAAVALDAGDARLAAARAAESAALADSLGMRLDAALARLLAGRGLARVGEREAAVAALRQAAAELDACGARRFRDHAEQELGRLGQRTPRRSRPGRSEETGIGSLTARELEVARLIVDRRTNAEIAAELFLSRKTVETHIRNLFHKLDVSSRVEVARLVERQS